MRLSPNSPIEDIAAHLSASGVRNLQGMSESWLTVSEMKGNGVTGSGADLLFVRYRGNELCERRWAKWGGEPGQKRGEGYEYRLTSLGVKLKAYLKRRQEG